MSGTVKSATNTAAFSRSKTTLSLREKISAMHTSSRFNLSFDWLSLLIAACVETTFRMNVPETLFYKEKEDAVLLFTDSEGMIRARSGKRAFDNFLFLCQSEQNKIDNVNPSGLFTPSFVAFRGEQVSETVQKKENLHWEAGEGVTKVQRYIPGKAFVPNKYVIWWRREKAMKVYCITSKVQVITRSNRERLEQHCEAQKFDPCPADSEFAYIASLRFLDICDVRRERRIPEDLNRMSDMLRTLLGHFVLPATQQLEELLISATFSLDSKCYFLNCSKARVSQIAEDSCRFSMRNFRRASSTRLNELIGNLQKVRESVVLPRYFPKEKVTYQPLLPPIRSESKHPHDPINSLVSRYLTSIAGSMDKIFQQSRARKHEAAMLLQKVKIMGYPAWFLPNVIDLFYDKISDEPKLRRFFRGSERLLDHIKGSMQQVFASGSYQSKIKAIHRHLEIGEEEFNLYVRAFGWAMGEEGAHPVDKGKAICYLMSFKDCVVTQSAEKN